MHLTGCIVIYFSIVACAVMEPSVGPIQLAKFDGTNVAASLNEGNLFSVLMSRPEIRELPTLVISVSGVARSGKSFLLNMLITYLTHLEENDCDEGWMSTELPIKGMPWAQSELPVTSGIWMWKRPFIIDSKHFPLSMYQPGGGPRKMAILLMDTQGTGDNSRAERLSTLIMYLSLQMSTLQLFNVWKYITSDDLAQLQLYTESERVLLDSLGTNDSVSNSLIFLIRDYQADDKYGEDTTHFSKLKQKAVDQEMVESANAVANSFHSISTFKFPYPGEVIVGASCGVRNWTLKDVNEKFVLVARSLFQKIIKPVWAYDRKTYWSTAMELYEQFKELKEMLEEQKLPIKSSAEALREIIAYKAYNFSSYQLTEEVEKLKERLREGLVEAEQLPNCTSRIQSEVSKSFNLSSNSEKSSATETWQKYYQILNDDFKSHFDGVFNILKEKEKYEEDRQRHQEMTAKLNKNLEEVKEKASEEIDQHLRISKITKGKEEAVRHQLEQLNAQIKRKKKRGIFGSLLRLIF